MISTAILQYCLASAACRWGCYSRELGLWGHLFPPLLLGYAWGGIGDLGQA